jgi:hypothetical protein
MTTTVTLEQLKRRLRNCLEGRETYDSFRSFVYSRYESEDEIVIDELGDELLSVLSPYIETEAAIPDSNRELRLRRLNYVLTSAPQQNLSTAAVFAINYDEICELERKLLTGVISQRVFEEQLEKLSPATYDVTLLNAWAKQHAEEQEPNVTKML